MHSVHLSDDTYTKALRRAADRGLKTVEEYVSEVIEEDATEENFDHLFTPEVMAAIDRGLADAEAGRVFSIEEIEHRMAGWREEWQRRHAS